MNANGMNNHEQQKRWFCIKLSLLFFWLSNMVIMLYSLTETCIAPMGICQLIHFNCLFSPVGKIMLYCILLVLSVLYLLEKKMWLTTFLLFVISCIIITYHESSGMANHATVFTVLFAVQSIAYLQKRLNNSFDLSFFRVQYCLQIIVAMYVLAGISKLRASGISWINSGELFSLQVVKNYSFIYFAHGKEAAINEGNRIAQQLIDYNLLLKFFLASSLVLELCCFVALFSARLRTLYTFALLGMHAGIKFIMAIPFGVIAPPMVIFFLNPLYWVIIAFEKTRAFIIFNR